MSTRHQRFATTRLSKMDYMQQAKYIVVTIVYVSLLLDNVLLTVVVPIIPVYLYTTDSLRLSGSASSKDNNTRGIDMDHDESAHFAPNSENARVALLLSSKALVQLVANPVVGGLVAQVGCRVPLLVGSFCLLISAALYAVAENYLWLFMARSLHGVASAFIGVAGMSAVAERFPTESSRSRAMGIVLGSVALGVLLGYPLGGMLYDWTGKSSPDRYVLVTAGAILVSTLAMAVLEPCLPLWLMETLHPQVPSAKTVLQLAAPHLGMGLGIGIVDASLVPLLARLVDSCDTYNARYGSVYALQQAAVSLAYALGPLVGGTAVRAFGFPWLMRLVGLLNLLYCPLLAWLAVVSPPAVMEEEDQYS
ncbi:hypothetical protein B566_EDAN016652 [Ephemera danica]|nr:hypothetical protein B566_EDAN016652 [Ephemera danica]